MTVVVRFPRVMADDMVAYCEAGRPNEACGLLAARGGEIVKVFCMSNVLASPVRYKLGDLEVMAVQDKIDEQGWELIGGFHSHTRTEAYPSPTDVREAWPDQVYVIVSLATEPAAIRAFRILKELGDEAGEIVEVPVEIVG